MTDRQRLVDDLIRDEGNELRVYPDAKGVPTIGVGRNLRDKGISSGESMLLLDHDVDEVLIDLSGFAWMTALDSVRWRAIANARFNLGAGGFRGFHNMIRDLSVLDFEGAARELLDSDAARENVQRYQRLARMLEKGADE